MANTIDKIRLNGTDYEIGGSGGGSNIVEVTQQEYEERPYDPDTLYIISDAEAVDVSGFATKDDLKDKQDKMTGNYLSKVDVGGSSISIETKAFVNEAVQKTDTINFKTINGNAIFGMGDIKIEGGGGSDAKVWTVSSLEETSLPGSELPFSEVKIGDIVQTSTNLGGDDITHQYVIITKSSMPQNPIDEYDFKNHLCLLKRKLTGDVYELVDLSINGNQAFQTWGNYSVTKTDVGNAYTKTQSDARYIQKGGLKTVNGQSLEGSGNIDIEGGGGSLPEGNYYYDSSFTVDWSTGKNVSNLILKRKGFNGSNDSEDNYFFSSINGQNIMSYSPYGLIVPNFELVTQEEFNTTVGNIEELLSRI